MVEDTELGGANFSYGLCSFILFLAVFVLAL